MAMGMGLLGAPEVEGFLGAFVGFYVDDRGMIILYSDYLIIAICDRDAVLLTLTVPNQYSGINRVLEDVIDSLFTPRPTAICLQPFGIENVHDILSTHAVTA
ncbi:MAG: hypothetical protein ABFD64_12495 [Armatimonadota bacterium]